MGGFAYPYSLPLPLPPPPPTHYRNLVRHDVLYRDKALPTDASVTWQNIFSGFAKMFWIWEIFFDCKLFSIFINIIGGSMI